MHNGVTGMRNTGLLQELNWKVRRGINEYGKTLKCNDRKLNYIATIHQNVYKK